VPDDATATNNNNSGDQQTEVQSLLADEVLAVHVVKSFDVITRLPVPEEETATNKFNS
jgi:hypothetical protein